MTFDTSEVVRLKDFVVVHASTTMRSSGSKDLSEAGRDNAGVVMTAGRGSQVAGGSHHGRKAYDEKETDVTVV